MSHRVHHHTFFTRTILPKLLNVHNLLYTYLNAQETVIPMDFHLLVAQFFSNIFFKIILNNL